VKDGLTVLARWLFPRGGTRIFFASLVFWNPVLAAAITFFLGGTRELLRSWIISLAIANVVTVSCFSVVHALRAAERAVHRLRGTTPPERGPAANLVVAAVAMPFTLSLGFRAGGVVAVWLGLRPWRPDLGAYRFGIGFGAASMVLFVALLAASRAREAALASDARIRDLETSRLRAELAALRAEMNPHLLFNALNTVAALIHKQPERAEEVVLQLADLYRGVLRSSGAAFHPLADELTLCSAYLDIEQARFGDRRRVDVAIDDAVDRQAPVPILLVQPLVENAVKHGIAPRARGGKVSVDVRNEAERLVVTVEDDGVGLGGGSAAGTGKGLGNARERLRLTYGDAARLDVAARADGGTRVVVSLPAREAAP
jgi:two-component sensor histidine kinase